MTEGLIRFSIWYVVLCGASILGMMLPQWIGDDMWTASAMRMTMFILWLLGTLVYVVSILGKVEL